ncbi:hypothetical protein LOTGIDRAFT_172929 [Lottia gigantea]|uniref:Uncharacterized protein n=1 Tax=Lottia gigantea TaxID=225164 RepID=V4B121_LOTGI|nr:hypothetical protein LOTGIDRAFT_172929 [Lottia gigantea]ESP00996.1 hypothetical protein LOTGIDRAFT_172929 [Lottia gigantea]
MKKLNIDESEIKLPTLPSSVLIDTPNDRYLRYRDHLNSFQKRHRGFVSNSNNTLPDLGKRQLVRKELNVAAPFRIQSNEFILTKGNNSLDNEMEKPGALNNIRYWSKKYKRLSHTLTDYKIKQSYSWTKLELQADDKQSNMATKSYKAKQSKMRRPRVASSSSSSTLSSSSVGTRIDSPLILYKLSGSSSNVKWTQTLAEFLVRYGFDRTSLCSMTGPTYQSLLSRIDSCVVDTSEYDEFARRKEKTIMDKLPRYTPRYNDYSVTKSELGPCFPVFVSEDSPIRKCGRVRR